MGRIWRHFPSPNRRQILRHCTERDTHANTFSDPNRDRYANSHSNGNSDSDSYSNFDADGQCHINCNGYVYSNPNCHSHSYSYSYCNRNAYGHTDRYGNGNCYANSYGQTYTNPKDRSYAKSSANARTPPVTLSGFVSRESFRNAADTGAYRGENSKDNFEKLNAVPFSRVVGIERCVLHPNPVAGRRPWIEHLKRVTTGTKCFRKHTLNCWPLRNRRRSRHRAHRFLPTDRRSEFLCRNSCNQRG